MASVKNLDAIDDTHCVVVASPAARLEAYPDPSLGWTVDNLLERKQYMVPAIAAATLILAFRPRRIDHLANSVCQRTSMKYRAAIKLICKLRDLRLILTAADVERDVTLQNFERTKSFWTRYGWEEAAEYHLATYDYPFLDYARGGRAVDTERMMSYCASEPDRARVKCTAGDFIYTLRKPQEAWSVGNPESGGDRQEVAERLLDILALTCGEVDTITPRRWPAEPLMHRTSPSGGARHPTETYLITWAISGLKPGVYHLQPRYRRLVRFDHRSVESIELEKTFPASVGRAGFEPGAVVVFTSRFERNMWRYRGPRTFRTVHMDVGHLCETLLMLAEVAGIDAFPAYNDRDSKIERLLNLNGLEEGYMMSVAIGSGRG